MDEFGLILGFVALMIVILPPKYDPMIKWKEHLEGWHKKERSEKTHAY